MQMPCNLLDFSSLILFFKNKIICNMKIEKACFFNDVSKQLLFALLD